REHRESSSDIGFGLDTVARAADASVRRMQDRLKQLSEQRRALEGQARTAESERRQLEAIINAMSEPIIVTDAFNELAVANDAAAVLWHIDPQRSRRQSIEQVLGDPVLAQIIRDMRNRGQA